MGWNAALFLFLGRGTFGICVVCWLRFFLVVGCCQEHPHAPPSLPLPPLSLSAAAHSCVCTFTLPRARLRLPVPIRGVSLPAFQPQLPPKEVEGQGGQHSGGEGVVRAGWWIIEAGQWGARVLCSTGSRGRCPCEGCICRVHLPSLPPAAFLKTCVMFPPFHLLIPTYPLLPKSLPPFLSSFLPPPCSLPPASLLLPRAAGAQGPATLAGRGEG